MSISLEYVHTLVIVAMTIRWHFRESLQGLTMRAQSYWIYSSYQVRAGPNVRPLLHAAHFTSIYILYILHFTIVTFCVISFSVYNLHSTLVTRVSPKQLWSHGNRLFYDNKDWVGRKVSRVQCYGSTFYRGNFTVQHCISTIVKLYMVHLYTVKLYRVQVYNVSLYMGQLYNIQFYRLQLYNV